MKKLFAIFGFISILLSPVASNAEGLKAICDETFIESLKKMGQEEVWNKASSLQRQMFVQKFVDGASLAELSQMDFREVGTLLAGAPVEILALVMRLVITRLKSEGAYPFEEPVIFDGGSFGQIILNRDIQKMPPETMRLIHSRIVKITEKNRALFPQSIQEARKEIEASGDADGWAPQATENWVRTVGSLKVREKTAEMVLNDPFLRNHLKVDKDNQVSGTAIVDHFGSLSAAEQETLKQLEAFGIALTDRPDMRQTVDTGGNGYLARQYATRDPMREREEWLIYANSRGGSRMLTGNTLQAHYVESLMTRLLWGKHAQTENSNLLVRKSTILATTGAVASHLLPLSLMRAGDLVLVDEKAHNSVTQGLLMAKLNQRVKSTKVSHNNIEEIKVEVLKYKEKGGNGAIWYLPEGVYSMDADAAPLRELNSFGREHHIRIAVDDAHGLGVMSSPNTFDGAGSVASAGMQSYPYMFIHGTLSKSMGVIGGYLSCPAIYEPLIRYSWPYRYTAAPSPEVLGKVMDALEHMLQTGPTPEVQLLAENSKYFADQLIAMKVPGVKQDEYFGKLGVFKIRIPKGKNALAIGALITQKYFSTPVTGPASGDPDFDIIRIGINPIVKKEDLKQLAALLKGLLDG